MKISICGSVYQKSSFQDLSILLESLLSLSIEHSVEIEERFYTLLMSQGFQLGGVSIMPPRSVANTDLLISIGGDGTFLRAAKLIAGTSAKIIGINSGRLGFLANVQPDEFKALWKKIIEGDYITEKRELLEVMVESADGKKISKGVVLNEVAMMKQDTASMISLDVYADEKFLASYEADGLLVSTPTGSTAYALSVNGPIVHPSSPVFTILPVASHMLTMRPIVLPNSVEVKVSIQSRTGTFLLACDGKSHTERVGNTVWIKLSSMVLNVLHAPDYSFYDTLRNKLMWGKDLRR